MSACRERVDLELNDDEQRLYERLKEATDADLRRMANCST